MIEQIYEVQTIESYIRGVYLIYDKKGKHLVFAPRRDMSNVLTDNLLLRFTLSEAERIGKELLELSVILKG